MKIKTRQKYKNEHSSTSVTITLGVRLLGSRQNFEQHFGPQPTRCKRNHGKIFIRFLVIIFKIKNGHGPATPFWVVWHARQNVQKYFGPQPTRCEKNHGKIFIRFLVIIFKIKNGHGPAMPHVMPTEHRPCTCKLFV